MENQAGHSILDSPMFGGDGFAGLGSSEHFWDDHAGTAIPQRMVDGDLTGAEDDAPPHEFVPPPPPPEVNAAFTQQEPYPAAGGAATSSVRLEVEVPYSGNIAPGDINLLESYLAGIDFSKATDEDILGRFCAYSERCKGPNNDYPPPPEADAAFARMDPWEMFADWYPGIFFLHFITAWMWGSDEKTTSQGSWEEVGIKVLYNFSLGFQINGGRKKLAGLKRTLQFEKNDGTRTNWFMNEYIGLEQCGDDFFLRLELGVLRCVYKDDGSSKYPCMKNINGEQIDELNRNNISHSDGFHHDTAQNNNQAQPLGKRPRTTDPPKILSSDVWQHFTRIYVKDGSKRKGDRKKCVYAVCNYCDKVFHADSQQGTSHHKRHAEACRCKHPQPSSS